VEPHLLPCTVCHRSAPADYQTKMLQQEALLFDLVQRYNNLPSVLTKPDLEQVLRSLHPREIPRHHASCLPLLDLEWHLKHTLFLNGLCSASSVKNLHCSNTLQAWRAFLSMLIPSGPMRSTPL